MFREPDKTGIFVPSIEIVEHPEKGYICIAGVDMPAHSLIERCLTIRFSRELMDELRDLFGGRTVFHDYNFRKNYKGYSHFAMGYGGVYSHSNNPNARWSLQYHANGRTTVDVRAIKNIKKGEEITFKYVEDSSLLWFDPVE